MRKLLPWVFGVWTIALSVGWLLSWISYPDVTLPLGLVSALTLVVGGFLSLRVRGNLIGPLLFGGASAAMIYDIGTAYALYSLGRGSALPGEHLAAWLGAWTLPLFFLSLPLLLILFPDGRFGGHRKLFLPLIGLFVVVVIVGAVGLWGVPTAILTDPTALDETSVYGILNAAFLSWWLMFPTATVSLFFRYRASGPIERQQIRWLLAAALLVPPVAWLLSRLTGDSGDILILAIAPCAVPVVVGIAVVRYRIYDLGRVVSRTVTYAVVIAILGLVVAGVATITAAQFEDPLVVAATTLAVAALFNPLRKRVQGWVDRRFNRSRYDAQRVMDAFAGSLQDGVDPEGVVDGWLGVVSETMQPQRIAVWISRQ